jgi:hypothetical protein
MPRNRIALLCAVLAVAVLAVPGCVRKPAVTTPVTTLPAMIETPTTTPSEVATEPASSATGAITMPALGSSERTELMDAARATLGTASQFYVYQLFAQGDTAIGDLAEVTGGKRYFVVWSGPEWKALWTAPFGSAGASAQAAKSSVPALSEELLGKIDWKMPKPVTDAAMSAKLAASAKTWAAKVMEGAGKPYKVTLIKVAKDKKGTWWGHVVVQPSDSAGNSYEAIEYWCKYSGGAWVGNIQDPEPPAPSTYFPTSVIGALGF